jgi:uncharacterized protein (TIGR04141 family)
VLRRWIVTRNKHTWTVMSRDIADVHLQPSIYQIKVLQLVVADEDNGQNHPYRTNLIRWSSFMPRRESKVKKVSLYRLIKPDGEPLSSCVQEKYIDSGFDTASVDVDGIPGLLVTGVISNPTPKWVGHVTSLTGSVPVVHNDTAAAVLLIPLEAYVFALTWGFGHLALTPYQIDMGFGLRFAIRRANPQQVRSLTIHTMDTLARTARTTVPSGAALDAFGMEEIGELVSRLVVRIPADGLTGATGNSGDYLTIRGADGLNIPLGREPAELISDLRYLQVVIETESPVSGLEYFEHTRPLRLGHSAIEGLRGQLGQALGSGSTRMSLSWPAEWEEEHGEASSYHLENLGRGTWEGDPEELELEHFTNPLAAKLAEQRLSALKKIRVQAIDSSGHVISRSIPGDRWITFETDLDGQRYIFHQGRWFNMGGTYLDMLRDRVTRIFAHRSNLSLPAWPKEVKKKGDIGPAVEGNYNIYAADQDKSLVLMDKKLLYTRQHPRGIEACDLLGPNNELIHVKRLDDSVSASHLFNQAIVSCEALCRQADALAEFRKRVRDQSSGHQLIAEGFRPQVVVLAFGGRAATPEALFTFSQVTLARCAERLGELNVALEITEIPESDEVVAFKTKK